MFISIDKTFDKRDDEPWDEYIERKVDGLAGFIANDGGEYFDFREIFYDREGVEVGHEFTLSLRYDDNDSAESMRCYCRAVEFMTPDDDQSGEDYEGVNVDQIKTRFLEFSEHLNAALGLTFSYAPLIESDLSGASADEEMLNMAEFSAVHESERLNEVVKATGSKLKDEEGMSL